MPKIRIAVTLMKEDESYQEFEVRSIAWKITIMSKRMDCTDKRKKKVGESENNVVRILQNSVLDNNNKALLETKLSTDSTLC